MGLVVSSVVAAEPLRISIAVRAQVIRIVGLLVIAAARARLTIALSIAQSHFEIIHVYVLLRRLIYGNISEAVLVTIAISRLGIPAVGLLVIGTIPAVLAIVLAVAQSLVKIIHRSVLLSALTDRNVAVPVLVTVAVSAQVVRVSRLTVIAAVATILAIVLTVLQALLKVPSRSALIVVAVLVVIPILLALLRRNRGIAASRAEPGEGHSDSQHPY